MCDAILIFTSVLWVKLKKKRPTTTTTRECEITNIILQDTTKGACLKLEPVRVAHERILDVLDNDSIRLKNAREADRLRAKPGTVAPPLPHKSTSTTCAKKASLVQSCCKTFRLIENLLLPTLPRTRPRRTGAQQKPRETTIKADLEPLFGSRVVVCAIALRWKSLVSARRNAEPGVPQYAMRSALLVMPAEPAPGWMPTQVQESIS